MLVDEISKNTQMGKQIDLILLDFSNAFDIVALEKLISKLHFNLWNSGLLKLYYCVKEADSGYHYFDMSVMYRRRYNTFRWFKWLSWGF